MAILPDGRTMPTTQWLAERLWAHLNGTHRKSPNDPYVNPIEVISEAVQSGDLVTAEAEFKSWVEHILVNVLAMGLEFKLLHLLGKLYDGLHSKNPAIWDESNPETTRTNIRDTLMAMYKLSELQNYNEEGEWVGPSPT